jgi:hypothetical protein
MPRTLLTLLENYLEDRKIVQRMTEGTIRRNVYAGAPQGSILGPLLRNLMYNGLLKELNGIPKTNVVAFAADYLTVILDVAKQKEVDNKLSTALGVFVRWCVDKRLKIAQEKTEVKLLTGKRIPKVIEINVEEHLLTTKKEIRLRKGAGR